MKDAPHVDSNAASWTSRERLGWLSTLKNRLVAISASDIGREARIAVISNQIQEIGEINNRAICYSSLNVVIKELSDTVCASTAVKGP